MLRSIPKPRAPAAPTALLAATAALALAVPSPAQPPPQAGTPPPPPAAPPPSYPVAPQHLPVVERPLYEEPHLGGWGEVRFGVGWVDGEGALDDDSGFEFAIAGGLQVDPQWLVGVELGGVSLDSGSSCCWDAYTSLDRFDLVARWVQRQGGSGWTARAGGGWLGYYGAGSQDGDGWSLDAGLGYEWKVAPNSYVSLGADYRRGNVDLDFGGDVDVESFATTVGFTFR